MDMFDPTDGFTLPAAPAPSRLPPAPHLNRSREEIIASVEAKFPGAIIVFDAEPKKPPEALH